MSDLADIRKDIDAIDAQMRELVLRRMDCSHRVARAKHEAGSTDVYRPDREREVLQNLGAGVPDDRRDLYLAVVRRVMEASRTYQYGLLYDWDEGVFATVEGSELADRAGGHVRVHFARPDRPGSLATVLVMVADYGFDVEQADLVGREGEGEDAVARFQVALRGDAVCAAMRKLLFQLSKECLEFRIIDVW